MARSRQRSTGSRARSEGGQDLSRAARSSRRSAGLDDDVEVIEEADTAGLETGIVAITFVILIGACLFLDAELGQHYGKGLFFK